MKKVLITGASRGIGRACALAFAKAGFDVAFTFNSSEDKASELKNEISVFCDTESFFCDFADTNDIKRLCRDIKEKFGHPDVIVNNAGVASYGLFQLTTEEETNRVFSVDFLAPLMLTREFIGEMVNKKYGRIINIASVWGERGASCEVLYSSCKAGMIGFTKSLAKELAPSGITVNSVSPGVIDTDMMSPFSEDEKNSIRDEIPASRFGTPEEVASACLYLASDGASYITGQVIGINGGMY